jgi:hypothetical protein
VAFRTIEPVLPLMLVFILHLLLSKGSKEANLSSSSKEKVIGNSEETS